MVALSFWEKQGEGWEMEPVGACRVAKNGSFLGGWGATNEWNLQIKLNAKRVFYMGLYDRVQFGQRTRLLEITK